MTRQKKSGSSPRRQKPLLQHRRSQPFKVPLSPNMPLPPGTRAVVYARPIGGAFDIFERVLEGANRGEYDLIIIYTLDALGDDVEAVKRNRARIEAAGLHLHIVDKEPKDVQ